MINVLLVNESIVNTSIIYVLILFFIDAIETQFPSLFEDFYQCAFVCIREVDTAAQGRGIRVTTN